ncbi:MAG: hypothetical protein CV087_05670 [Candidatus Brocadia sp. WS118]|nr:MAG: hypothetical protein CV087_05670 [Candidatus Brocadia sp. WS118]
MNAVEHIVECYFRYCKECFTITDLKIKSGNNRQVDLLAYNLKTSKQYHIESSVTHSKNWWHSTEDLHEIFNKKFRGLPPKREGKKTDYVKGKEYFDSILQAYQRIGFAPSKINRIFVTWAVKDDVALRKFLVSYKKQYGFRVDVLSFRDQILPELRKAILTSNYDDEVLRTLSLLKQCDLQTSDLTTPP